MRGAPRLRRALRLYNLREVTPLSPPTQPIPGTCPSCGAAATGRFCASCGSPLAGATCASCSAELSPGAKFCHRCGAPAGAVALARAAPANPLPWIVAALAFLALFAMAAGRGFSARPGSSLDGSQNALPPAGLDDPGMVPQGPRAPDISNLSPQERADRLYNRVMLLASQGKTNSVQFFAPMAITSYQMLSPLNIDQRYDMGRIGEVAGALPLAQAQADSILSEDGNHLLGLILQLRLAALARDTTRLRGYERKLLAVERTELARNRDEYTRHRDDILSALEQ